MSYDYKKKRQKSNWEFDSRPQTLESRGQMNYDWDVLYTIGKIFLSVIRNCHFIFKTNFMGEKYECPKFLAPLPFNLH